MKNRAKDILDPRIIPFFDVNGGFQNFKTHEIGALSQLVSSLVGKNLWEKMIAIYPFVGQTSARHSYNIKNILKYKITWNSEFSLTHDKYGVTSTGNSGWGNTNIPLSIFENKLNDIHLSAYNRTPLSSAGADGRLIGVNSLNILTNYSDSGAQELNFSANGGIIGYVYSEYNNLGGYGYKASESSGVSGKGFMIGTNCNKCYLNGELFGSWQPLLPTEIIPICPRKIILFGNRYETSVTSTARVNLAFASVGYGLSEQDAKNMNEILETFQKAMRRSVL